MDKFICINRQFSTQSPLSSRPDRVVMEEGRQEIPETFVVSEIKPKDFETKDAALKFIEGEVKKIKLPDEIKAKYIPRLDANYVDPKKAYEAILKEFRTEVTDQLEGRNKEAKSITESLGARPGVETSIAEASKKIEGASSQLANLPAMEALPYKEGETDLGKIAESYTGTLKHILDLQAELVRLSGKEKPSDYLILQLDKIIARVKVTESTNVPSDVDTRRAAMEGAKQLFDDYSKSIAFVKAKEKATPVAPATPEDPVNSFRTRALNALNGLLPAQDALKSGCIAQILAATDEAGILLAMEPLRPHMIIPEATTPAPKPAPATPGAPEMATIAPATGEAATVAPAEATTDQYAAGWAKAKAEPVGADKVGAYIVGTDKSNLNVRDDKGEVGSQLKKGATGIEVKADAKMRKVSDKTFVEVTFGGDKKGWVAWEFLKPAEEEKPVVAEGIKATEKAAEVKQPTIVSLEDVPVAKQPTTEQEPLFVATNIENLVLGNIVKLVNSIGKTPANSPVRIAKITGITGGTPTIKFMLADGVEQARPLIPGQDFTVFEADEVDDARETVASMRRAYDMANLFKDVETKTPFGDRELFAKITKDMPLSYVGELSGEVIQNGAVTSGDIVAVIGKTPDGKQIAVQQDSTNSNFGYIPVEALQTDMIVRRVDKTQTPKDAIEAATKPKEVEPTVAPAAAEEAKEEVVTNLEGLSKSAGFVQSDVYKKDGNYYIEGAVTKAGKIIYKLQANGALGKTALSDLVGAGTKGVLLKDGTWKPISSLVSGDEAKELAALGLKGSPQ